MSNDTTIYGYSKAIHETAESIIELDIYYNQTLLVEELFSKEVFQWDDVTDFYDSNSELKEVFEWWLVSEQLSEQLSFHSEPILSNSFGNWWGRCVFGQSIILDGTIQEIVMKIEASS